MKNMQFLHMLFCVCAMVIWSVALFGQDETFDHPNGWAAVEVHGGGGFVWIAYDNGTISKFAGDGTHLGDVITENNLVAFNATASNIYVVSGATDVKRYDHSGVFLSGENSIGGAIDHLPDGRRVQLGMFSGVHSLVIYDIAGNSIVANIDHPDAQHIAINPNDGMIAVFDQPTSQAMLYDDQLALKCTRVIASNTKGMSFDGYGTEFYSTFSAGIGVNSVNGVGCLTNGNGNIITSPEPTGLDYAEGMVLAVQSGVVNGYNAGSGPLPIELIKFEVSREKGLHHLNWQTVTEINFWGFEIQHSMDGKVFTKIGFVEGTGKAAIYSFQANPKPEVNYYRLKQVDLDGYFEYSPIRSAEGGMGNAGIVYPNPSNGFVTVSHPSIITNGLGQQLTKTTAENEQLTLPAGTYYVRFINPAFDGQVSKLFITK